ncbi:MAG: hypothetical protein B7Z68_04370 [Acidobacteria bacterium 21-70-11]|nr:MAG: hypothetical protein B7Z68_04370 [Acidobacteria bacterium 21-70-11]HQT95490.1 UPF0158 family protein [Thermoanaerobaculaceae bacterium]HQU33686.1 UPF0158 family protein [Thermoanaerobaculaceae bacterium]
MSTLVIDAEELIMALEGHSYEMTFFIDRRTGEVFPVFEDNEESDADRERIDAEPARFVAVDPIPSSVAWEVMAGFVESLPPGKARDTLDVVLGVRHPFRAFKDVLSAYPTVRDEWYAFHDREWARLAGEWLEEEGIDAALRVRSRVAGGGREG